MSRLMQRSARSAMRHGQRIVAVNCLLLALAGCAVGPDYRRPDSALPGQFGEAETSRDAASAGDSLVRDDWWTLFNDPVLDALIKQAMAGNADMLQAVARIEEAEAVAREAGAAQFPEIDGNLEQPHPGQHRDGNAGARRQSAPAQSAWRQFVHQLRTRCLGALASRQRSRQGAGAGQSLRA